MRRWQTAVFSILALAGIIGPAAADDCKLTRLAEIDFDFSHGKISIPVTIEGSSRRMDIDTGSPLSAIDPKTTTDLGLITHRIFQDSAYDARGEQFTQMAVIHSFGLGQMSAQDVKMLVWPSRMFDTDTWGGTLGADLLRHYDIDLDFANRQFGLFSQDHCPGQVVYWPAQSVAVIPIHVEESGHIVVPVSIDGHELNAVLDTGAYTTFMSEQTASDVYGLAPGSPDMKPVIANAGDVPWYSHTFRQLSLQGIVIANPLVLISNDQAKSSMAKSPPIGSRLSDAGESGGVTGLILGLHELRSLHVYIAYKEEKLYVTPADAQPMANSSATATTTAAH